MTHFKLKSYQVTYSFGSFKILSCVHAHAQSCPTLCDPKDCILPGSSVHGIFWQEYWGELPFPTPGYLPNPGMELMSLVSPILASRFFTTVPPGNPLRFHMYLYLSIYLSTYLTYSVYQTIFKGIAFKIIIFENWTSDQSKSFKLLLKYFTLIICKLI